MTTIDGPQRTEIDLTDPTPAPAAPPTGDPLVLGLPTFIVGSLALGLSQVGYLPAAASAGILPIVFAATGLGLFVAAIWAAALAQNTVACINGVFAGFWWSYGALVLGLNHGWYVVAAADVTKVVGLFLICWTIVVGVLTLATLRLPSSFTVLLGLVTVALALVTIGTLNTSTGFIKAAGVVVLAFTALGIYLFLSVSDAALGGPGYALGRPLRGGR